MYSLNESFFDNINSELPVYWLGFIAADGCVESDRVISIQLADKDRQHLQMFLDAMGCNKPIYESIKKGKKYARVTINSARLVSKLAENGIGRRKSLSLQWPTTIADELMPYYIRGYFDGDGMWSHQKKDKYLMFGFIGSDDFMLSLRSWLRKRCHVKGSKLTGKIGRRWKVWHVGGNLQSQRFYDYIYSGATLWLPRKRRKADMILNQPTLVCR